MADNIENEGMLEDGEKDVEHYDDAKMDEGIEKEHPAVLLERIEQRIFLSNGQLVLAFSAFFGAYIALGTSAILLCNLITIGYPAYESIKAVITKREPADVQWLIYWAVLAFLAPFDLLSNTLPIIIPCYWLLKYVFLLYLCLPQTEGALLIYRIIFGAEMPPEKNGEDKEYQSAQKTEVDFESPTMTDSSTNTATAPAPDATEQTHSDSTPIPPPRQKPAE